MPQPRYNTRVRRPFLYLILAFLLPTAVWAQKVKINTVSVEPGHRQLVNVHFDPPEPSAGVIQDSRYWVVYQKTSGGPTRVLVQQVDVSNLTANGDIQLILETPLPDKDLKEVDVILASASDFVEVPPVTSPAALALSSRTDKGLITKSKEKSDSDVYFSGSYTGVQNGDPVYDIDAFAGYMHAIQKKDNYYGSAGLYGQTRTKTSAVADPDSFLTYLVYQYPIGSGWIDLGKSLQSPAFQKPILSFRTFGAEFSRTGKELNLITSPVLTFPLRPIGPQNHDSGKVSPWPQINVSLGTEFVYVKKSVLAPIGEWHTRGLASGTFTVGYAPKKKAFDSIQLTSAYQGRFPSAPEIFYDSKFAPKDPTTGKPNPKKTPPMLGTQPRHNLDTKLTYNFAPWTGVTFEHTYGSLPPIFNKTNNSFAFGLTVNFQFSEFGRYSILRP